MTQSASTVLRVSNLSIERDEAFPLSNVDWCVRAGEHWAILGANGSGKTSLLGALTAYIDKSRGEVELLGYVYGRCEWREIRKYIGLVSSAIHKHVWEADSALRIVASGKYAAFGAWSEPNEEDLARAERLLEQVQAPHIGGRPWRVLSQGERQRVLIARALMADPRLLLLDEPCAGLDPVARERLLRVIDRLARSSAASLVLVTHHVEEIVPAITHVLILHRGRVLAAGPKLEVVTSEALSTAYESPIEVTWRGAVCNLNLRNPDPEP